jgi:hypothetical protein
VHVHVHVACGMWHVHVGWHVRVGWHVGTCVCQVPRAHGDNGLLRNGSSKQEAAHHVCNIVTDCAIDDSDCVACC